MLATTLMLTVMPSGFVRQESFGAVPSKRQLAWHKMEYYAFIHFGPNTFTDREWGEGVEDPNLFNPSQLDCNQWAKTIKDAGMKGVVLTAKHHDGFCLWPSKYSTHTVAQTKWGDGKRDILRELSDACKKQKLKLGVYLSPWDRNHPTYGTPEYNQVFAKMLTEVLTKYGPIFEVWFDGANGEGPNGKKQVYDWDLFIGTVRKYQPNAVIFSDAGPDIRWVGNEAGYAAETNWCTINRDRYKPGTEHYRELTEGTMNGTHWVPAECDVSIRPGWFYHASQDAQVKTIKQLDDIWYGSVGQNANLILNLPPDKRGLIHENDVAALNALRTRLDGTFSQELSNKLPAEIDRVWLAEKVQFGQRVKKFHVEARVDGEWKTIAAGTTIGYRRILRFAPVMASEVRVVVDDSLAPALLEKARLYCSGG